MTAPPCTFPPKLTSPGSARKRRVTPRWGSTLRSLIVISFRLPGFSDLRRRCSGEILDSLRYPPHPQGERMATSRKMIDCRRMPSERNCSVSIAGTEDEVLALAVRHAVEEHGHQDTPELREMLRQGLIDEPAEVHA